jgi:hypothetical protein
MCRYGRRMRMLALLLVLASGAACASALRGPRSFLNRVIAYETSGRTRLHSATFLRFLTPRLRAAVISDISGEEVGTLDYDPLCACQDDDGLHMRIVSVQEQAATANAVLRSVFAAEARQVGLHLMKTPSGWRIADITSTDGGSLLAQLESPKRRRRWSAYLGSKRPVMDIRLGRAISAEAWLCRLAGIDDGTTSRILDLADLG